MYLLDGGRAPAEMLKDAISWLLTTHRAKSCYLRCCVNSVCDDVDVEFVRCHLFASHVVQSPSQVPTVLCALYYSTPDNSLFVASWNRQRQLSNVICTMPIRHLMLKSLLFIFYSPNSLKLQAISAKNNDDVRKDRISPYTGWTKNTGPTHIFACFFQTLWPNLVILAHIRDRLWKIVRYKN